MLKKALTAAISLTAVAVLVGPPLWDLHQERVRDARPERQHAAPGYCIIQDAAGDYWLGSPEYPKLVYHHMGTYRTFLDAVRKTWRSYDFHTNYMVEPRPVGPWSAVDCTH